MKFKPGFQLLNGVDADQGILRAPVAASVTIAAGDALSFSSGYLALSTALDSTFAGIAAEAVNNSTGSAGDKDCSYYPPLPKYKWLVPVEANTVITQAHVGAKYDLSSEDGITLADTTVTANAFQVTDFEAGAVAVAANTYGYAIGKFIAVT